MIMILLTKIPYCGGGCKFILLAITQFSYFIIAIRKYCAIDINDSVLQWKA